MLPLSAASTTAAGHDPDFSETEPKTMAKPTPNHPISVWVTESKYFVILKNTNTKSSKAWLPAAVNPTLVPSLASLANWAGSPTLNLKASRPHRSTFQSTVYYIYILILIQINIRNGIQYRYYIFIYYVYCDMYTHCIFDLNTHYPNRVILILR